MCLISKQILNIIVKAILLHVAIIALGAPVMAIEPVEDEPLLDLPIDNDATLMLAKIAGSAPKYHEKNRVQLPLKRFHSSMGGLAVGEPDGGIVDRYFVTAPPNWVYFVENQRGSFVDCGEVSARGQTDPDGRDMAALNCGVTITETMVIPAAAQSARLIVHF